MEENVEREGRTEAGRRAVSVAISIASTSAVPTHVLAFSRAAVTCSLRAIES